MNLWSAGFPVDPHLSKQYGHIKIGRILEVEVRVALLILTLFSSIETVACMAPVLPHDLGTGKDPYSQIVLGEIVGVVLTGYVDDRLSGMTAQQHDMLDHTPPHKLTVLVGEVIRGTKKPKLIEVTASGCGITSPKLRHQVLLFIEAGSEKAIPIYASSNKLYEEWLSEARSSTN